MGIELCRPGIYTPERGKNDCNVLTNYDLEGFPQIETSEEWIIQRSGISERRIEFEKTIPEMALASAEDYLKKNNVSPEEIDEIILSTNHHHLEQAFPCHAGYSSGYLKTRNIPIHDSNAGCSGLVYALREAYNTMKVEEDKKHVLVIAVEKLSEFTNYNDRSTCFLFGDAAVTYGLRERKEIEGIVKNVVGGKPDLEGHLCLSKMNGLRIRPINYAGEKGVEFKYETEKFKFEEVFQNYLVMDGQEVFKFATPAMRDAVHKVVEEGGYKMEDLDLIIPHGANIRIINAAEKGLKNKGFKGKVYTNLHKYGNTSSASGGIAQNEAIEEGVLEEGMLYCIVKFGAGLTWGATLARHAA